MVPIISIRMGNMLGHGSWSMSWLVARGSRLAGMHCVGRYLPTYLHPTYPTYKLGHARLNSVSLFSNAIDVQKRERTQEPYFHDLWYGR